jgi:thioredoxin-related protein
METRNFLTAAILFLFLVSNSYSQTSYSFNEGLNAAKTSGKKIFLDIFSGSDNWCKKTESEVFTSDKVMSALSNFIFIKLNADSPDKYKYENKEYTSVELAKRFGGTGYPTFVFLNSDGNAISFKYNGEQTSYLSGFLGQEDFVDMLNFFTQNKYKDTDISTIFNN